MNGRTNKQINERTNKNVLQDFVPFGAAAQKRMNSRMNSLHGRRYMVSVTQAPWFTIIWEFDVERSSGR